MDLITLAIGIALGALFSPFWMKVWGWIKGLVNKGTTPPAA
jgi:hypothetical protein